METTDRCTNPSDLLSTLTRDALSPHREATLNIPPPPPLHPLLHLSFPSCSGWGFEDIDSGTHFLTFSPQSWLPLLYPYRITFPNQKGERGEIRWLLTPPSSPSQTSVCRSMMSCPTRGMVVPAFSHSTECSSRGEAAKGSRSLRTHAGGDCWIPRTPSHGLSRGPCCLSCWGTKRRHFNTGVNLSLWAKI